MGQHRANFTSRRFVQDFVENDKPKHRRYEIFPDSGFYRESDKAGKDTTLRHARRAARRRGVLLLRSDHSARGRQEVRLRRATSRRTRTRSPSRSSSGRRWSCPTGARCIAWCCIPIIDTKGLFSKRSDTRIWLTDDERRLPVQIRTKFPFGTITLRLKDMVLPSTHHFSHRAAERALSRGRPQPPHDDPGRRAAEQGRPARCSPPPGPDRSFAAFLASLPDVLAARDLRAVIAGVAGRGASQPRRRAALLGGHVVKVGLGPLINAWMARGIVTHVAMNGAAAIHDFELAAFGGTSEDVESWSGRRQLRDGRGDRRRDERGHRRGGAAQNQGMGEGLARALAPAHEAARGRTPRSCSRRWSTTCRSRCTPRSAPRSFISIPPPTAPRSGRPATATSGGWPARCPTLTRAGSVLNWGSAVVLPEVFLKALTIARNLEGGRPTHFLAADFDMQRHYRPASERGAAAHPRGRHRLPAHRAPRDA